MDRVKILTIHPSCQAILLCSFFVFSDQFGDWNRLKKIRREESLLCNAIIYFISSLL